MTACLHPAVSVYTYEIQIIYKLPFTFFNRQLQLEALFSSPGPGNTYGELPAHLTGLKYCFSGLALTV